jgi:BED zinc finger
MFKYNSGRKQESSVWKYFEYDTSTDKSTCTVAECHAVLKGKNATNMRTHVNSKHKDIAAKLTEFDKDTKDKHKTTQQQLKVIAELFNYVLFILLKVEKCCKTYLAICVS